MVVNVVTVVTAVIAAIAVIVASVATDAIVAIVATPINAAFLNTDWFAILGKCTPDGAAEILLEYVLKL